MIVFDIETGPLPIEQLRSLMPPFDDAVKPFDPASVKVGNLKDPAKINEKIEAARASHEAFAANVDQRRAAHEQDFVDRAALKATTGRVLAIGYRVNANAPLVAFVGDQGLETERKLLANFWDVATGKSEFIESPPFVGHNIFGFDLPFLVRRSWLLELDVPATVRNGRYWAPIFVDTMDVWGCGSRELIGLDELAKSFGLAGKNGDGADFYGLYESDRAAAIEYLSRDLELTYEVALRLQIL